MIKSRQYICSSWYSEVKNQDKKIFELLLADDKILGIENYCHMDKINFNINIITKASDDKYVYELINHILKDYQLRK